MNSTEPVSPPTLIARQLRVLGQPIRIRLLLALGEGEACVCHLEARLGQRQAYISQQLMLLRDAGLVTTRREGRNIYYRLQGPQVLDLIRLAGEVSGLAVQDIQAAGPAAQPPLCSCPQCCDDGESPAADPIKTSR